MSRQQLSLALDRWPIPVDGALYDNADAHRQVFEQRCAKGVVCIELFVLEVVPDTYIQACQVQLADISDGTPLRMTPRNRYDTPEEAVQVAAKKAMRLIKSRRKQSGLYPECQSTLLRAENWLEDVLHQCEYLLDRQVKLFG